MDVYRKIDDNDIISFDMFDTLIKRYVPTPSDVFSLVEQFYNNRHTCHIHGFKDNRINSEMCARKNNNYNEINIDDIYKYIKYDNVDARELKVLEEKIETEVCYRNDECVKLLNYAKKKKKKIIITTDMYLSQKTIEAILNKNNIIYDRLFLSNEVGRKKSNRSLFEYIKEIYSNKKILHIGDNFKSDILNAKRSGIDTYWWKRKDMKCKNIQEYMLKNFVSNNIKKKQLNSSYEEFGYMYLGPLLFGFCKYINKNVKDENNLIFLAREGNLLKKCYDSIFFTQNKTKYMYVSRKSISSDAIFDFDKFNEFSSIQSFSQNETIEIFLKRYNLYNKKNIILVSKLIDLNETLYSEKSKEFFKNNFEMLLNNAKNERLLQNYLESFDINTNTTIVDIGWNGTMQDLIEKKIGFSINGLYLGVRARRKNNQKHGFIFENNEFLESCSRSMVGFLEILFSANHGTTIGYEKIKNEIHPIIQENDIPENTMKFILEIQEGAIKFVEDFKEFGNFFYQVFEDGIFYRDILNIGLNPTNKVIQMFMNFEIYDEKVEKLIGSKGVLYYIFHFKRMKYDYIESSWKNAFLKSIFKINLPYFKFFQLSYKFRRNM